VGAAEVVQYAKSHCPVAVKYGADVRPGATGVPVGRPYTKKLPQLVTLMVVFVMHVPLAPYLRASLKHTERRTVPSRTHGWPPIIQPGAAVPQVSMLGTVSFIT
jgi:hypothetical protein